MSSYTSNITSVLCQYPRYSIPHQSPNLSPTPNIQDDYLRM